MFRNELKGWKTWEVLWLLLACVTILSLSIYWQDTTIGIISATTGVACVVFTGKGKLSAYLFGIINTALYAFIAFKAQYYGEVMLNVLYYFPLQFYGLYIWSRNINPETYEVSKRRMATKERILLLFIVGVGTSLYGLLLQKLGGALPFVDALSTMVSIVAMIVSIKMFVEQWMLWIIVDVVTVVMWAVAFAKGKDSIATLIMWLIYLGNAIIMHFKWAKEARENAI
ncbi:MAG: nicotinamide riboside transporter PnuC [Clostridiaceae bacterium]